MKATKLDMTNTYMKFIQISSSTKGCEKQRHKTFCFVLSLGNCCTSADPAELQVSHDSSSAHYYSAPHKDSFDAFCSIHAGGPVRKARGPAPVALNSPAGLPTMRTSAGSVQSMTQQRIVVSGDMASMRSSTSESLIGLAGINNLELLETQHPQPQGTH